MHDVSNLWLKERPRRRSAASAERENNEQRPEPAKTTFLLRRFTAVIVRSPGLLRLTRLGRFASAPASFAGLGLAHLATRHRCRFSRCHVLRCDVLRSIGRLRCRAGGPGKDVIPAWFVAHRSRSFVGLRGEVIVGLTSSPGGFAVVRS